MLVAELWRYPVKSLRGERLDEARLEAGGMAGDRIVQVRDRNGKPITGRRRPAMVGVEAVLGDDGEPRIEGHAWSDPEAEAVLRARVGKDATLARAETGERYVDDSPLLVATDGAIAHQGIDGRRLRPNIVVAGVEGLDERDWPGRRLRVGEAVLDVQYGCERCKLTTVDPDTQDLDLDILRRINDELGGTLALNCAVAEPGVVLVGDPVVLL